MEKESEIIEQYFSDLKYTIDNLSRVDLIKTLNILREARDQKKSIFIFGNGGSAATSSHMCCDFGKNTRRSDKQRLKVYSLNDNIPTLMAYANDEGYENVFSEPLKTLGVSGDVAIAISGSGNSPNVLQAVETARNLGLYTIGLTGFSGGKIKDIVDHCIIVPSNSMERVEDLHMIIDHILTVLLRDIK